VNQDDQSPFESGSSRNYSVSNLLMLAVFVISLLAFLNASILALSWSKKPFLGFVVEPTLVVSNVGGVEWNAQLIGLNYPERLRQIGERLVSSTGELTALASNLSIGSPVVIGTVFPDGAIRVYPSVRVTAFPTFDLIRFFWLPFIIGLAYLGIGFWIYRLRGDATTGRAFAAFCISAALATGLYFDLITTHVLSDIWTIGISFLGGSLVVLALVFPEEWSRVKRYRFLRYLPYLISLALAAWGLYALRDSSNPWAYVDPWRYSYIYTSIGIFFFLGVMFYRQFRTASAAIRQQARIVLWGSLFAFTPIAIWMLAPYLGVQLPWNPGLFLPFLIIFPIAIAIAIMRYGLWDIDVIVNRTLVYGLLTIVLALVYLASVLIVQRSFQTFTGESSDLAAVASTLVIVALFFPIRNFMQDFVDRRFYRRRYDAAKAVESFSRSLRDEVDLTRLIERLERVIGETILPSQVNSWLPVGTVYQVYIPEDGIGKDSTSLSLMELQFTLDDPLLDYFRDAPGTIDLQKVDLDEGNHQRLLSAGVVLIVPLITRGELIGWLGLGERLSGQEYSANDRRLLSRLAIRVAPSVRVAQLVTEQQAEALARERLDQELLVARRIQDGFLPKSLPELADWEMSAFYQPAREVGGDFYEFKYFKDGRLGIFIGDVTDKGIPAAMVMATTRTLLLAVAQESLTPGQVLAKVNNLLQTDIPDNMFVTCFYAVLDPGSGEIAFANAGHNLPYRRTCQEVNELKAAGMPLGLMPDVEYDDHRALIEPGEVVLFYSDGLVEAHDDQRKMFGSNRLIGLFADLPDDVTSMIEQLLADFDNFTGPNWEQEDDITIVGVKRYNTSHQHNGDEADEN
jgi:serine phosphatase RsbU (regulator of sigma subunit)